MRSASARHQVTQIPQALQSSVSIEGFFQLLRGTLLQGFPCPSKTAFLGQTRPQTPQETQRLILISYRCFGSPVIARTGQIFAQAEQPIQSPVIKNGMSILLH
jgi:hypothetical protein